MMSKLSILQQIFPLTLKGGTKYSNLTEKETHSTSRVLNSSWVSLTGSPNRTCAVGYGSGMSGDSQD